MAPVLEEMIRFRNGIIRLIYVNFLKPMFFVQDPEKVHDRMTSVGAFLGSNFITQEATGVLFNYYNPILAQTIKGIKFDNPVGLAAGFDKNAELTQILPSVGFGFEEVGSITGEPCEGNSKPRLWRLKKSKGLLVYYGLKNDGAEAIAARLKKLKFKIPLGTSIAKTNCKDTVDTKKGIADYAKAYEKLKGIGAYTTINISCPNAFGGEPFTDPKKLDALLKKIRTIKSKKPIFLKMSPDLKKTQIDAIIKIAGKYKVDGFIFSNLTKNRKNPKLKDKLANAGGISGKPVTELSLDVIRYVYKKTKGKFVIIGCGGVFCASDAYRMIKAGASLIQMITGMIYEGPQAISSINEGLIELLERDGFPNISHAVGADNN